MAKAGIKGLGPFYVLLMSQVFGSKASTGVIVPLFSTNDGYLNPGDGRRSIFVGSTQKSTYS